MHANTIGVDLAKNVFQIHGVDSAGKVVITRQLRRKQVLEFFSKLPGCLVGMEACGTGHHWAREISKLGHTVRLMPPSYVKGYVKRSKNDAADAAAICEAVTRPSMRFVPIKSTDQLSPCLVGIEACGSSHHWSRELQALGHTVRLIHPRAQSGTAAEPSCHRRRGDRVGMQLAAVHEFDCDPGCVKTPPML